jgi:periplasmic protein TonB
VPNPASSASRDAETGVTTSPPAARPQVDIVAITLGDDFLIDLGEALAGQATLRPVDTAAAAVEQIWSSRRGQVLVIDTRDLADVHSELQLAVTQAPHAVVLLFVPAGEEPQVSDAVQGLPVQAVLPIPLDRRKTALALNSALADAAGRKPPERRPTAAPLESQGSEAFALTLEPEPRSRKVGLWVGLALATVAVGGTGYWLLRSGAPAVITPAADAAHGAAAGDSLLPQKLSEVPLVAGKVDDLLEKARQAMRGFHYIDPEKDCALLYYRSALAGDANNAEAKDGLLRIANWALARFDDSLSKGRLDDAQTTLAALKQALPGDPRLSDLEQKLTDRQFARYLADGNFDNANKLLVREAAVITPDQAQKYRAEIARHEEDAKIGHLTALVEAAIRDGKLLDPPDDNARTYVQQLQGVSPKSQQTQRATHDLAAALLRHARDTKGGPDMEHFLAEARNFGVQPAEIEAVRRDITQARQKAEVDRLLAVFHDRLRDGKLTEPAQDSAAAYLSQVQAADPGSFAAASHELANKLLDRARTAFTQGRTAAAEADLNQARRYGADPKDVAALQQTEAARAAAAAPATSTKAAAGTGGSSSSTAGGPQLPKLLRGAQPEFPEKARQQNIGGSVTVQFVIDVNGDTRDVRVVESTPPGIFDRAAVAAVKRYHYQPTVVDGKPVEVPVQIPIRFPKPE